MMKVWYRASSIIIKHGPDLLFIAIIWVNNIVEDLSGFLRGSRLALRPSFLSPAFDFCFALIKKYGQWELRVQTINRQVLCGEGEPRCHADPLSLWCIDWPPKSVGWFSVVALHYLQMFWHRRVVSWCLSNDPSPGCQMSMNASGRCQALGMPHTSAMHWR